MQQLLQVFLQLVEVDGGDDAFMRFGQAVSGQLCDLVVDEAEDPVSQRQHVLRRVRLDELSQALLHLSRGLKVRDTQHCYDRTIFVWDTTIWKSGIWGSKKN